MKKILILFSLILAFACEKNDASSPPEGKTPPELYISWETDTGMVRHEVTEKGVKGNTLFMFIGGQLRYFVFRYTIDSLQTIEVVFSNYVEDSQNNPLHDMLLTFTEGSRTYDLDGYFFPGEVRLDLNDNKNLAYYTTGNPLNRRSTFEITKVEEVKREDHNYLKIDYEFNAVTLDISSSQQYEYYYLRNGKGTATFRSGS